MTEAALNAQRGPSVFALGVTLLRHRWRIVRWIVVGAVLAFATVWSKPLLYSASASFAPQQSGEASRSGLASIAGQFGVSIPGGNAAQSPEFYSRLVTSRAVLDPILHDSVSIPELGGRRTTVIDALQVEGSPTEREERGITALKGAVASGVSKTTGVVEVSVTTRWRSLSMFIAQAVIDGVNAYNERARQGQADAERKFIEGRLAVAASEQRAAEDRLEQFMVGNRQFSGSPQLATERDRLEHDLMSRQQVFTSLTQAYDDARIREFRNTPVITTIDVPWASTTPASRGRLLRVLIGMLLGGLIGVLLSLASEAIADRRSRGDVHVNELVGALHQARGEVLGSARRLTGRAEK